MIFRLTQSRPCHPLLSRKHASTGPVPRGRTAAHAGKSTVVIGGGIGGLTVAAKLAKAGLHVTLLEQNEEVGGRCQSMHVQTEKGQFRFDTGPSLMLFPDVYKKTFASLGTSLEAHVPIQRVRPAAYRVWFEPRGGRADKPDLGSAPTPAPQHPQGGGYLDLLYDVPEMRQQLEDVEEGAGRAYLSWLAQSRAALEVGLREFIERDFDSIFDFLDLRRLLPLLGQVDVAELLGPHHQRLARQFKDPRIQALLSFQDLYVGLSPYTAPGVFSLLAATEISDGVCYPIGGFQKVKQGLADVATELGVVIRTSARVTGVNTKTTRAALGKELNAVSGVVLESGEEVAADVVVSNRDVPLSYELLAKQVPGAADAQQHISSLDYSASVIAYNLCLDTTTPLLHHNVFVSAQGKHSWERATSASSLLPRPNFYVHCPSRTDHTAAPQGCDSLMVLLPVANLQEARRQEVMVGNSQLDEAGLVTAGRDAIARTFREEGVCKDLWSQVIHETVIGPQEWRDRYSIEHGAVFGLSHSLDQLAYFRPGAKTDISGFYLVGASARPGNGVPLVMISADQAAKRVLQDLDKANRS